MIKTKQESKQIFNFNIEDFWIDVTNVLGSTIELKKFELQDEKKESLNLEYENRFELWHIQEFKKAIKIIDKIADSVKFELNEEELLILSCDTKTERYEAKFSIKGRVNEGSCKFSIEYLKAIIDSLNLKEIEKIEIYLNEDYPLSLKIINEDGSENKIVLAPRVDV